MKKVIEMRYGLKDGIRRTQREISRYLGISRSYVSRIEKRVDETSEGDGGQRIPLTTAVRALRVYVLRSLTLNRRMQTLCADEVLGHCKEQDEHGKAGHSCNSHHDPFITVCLRHELRNI